MDVGAYLVGLWDLLNPIVEAMASRHCPRQCAATEFGPFSTVHIANALLRALEVGDEGQPSSYLDMDYLSQIGLVKRLLRVSLRARLRTIAGVFDEKECGKWPEVADQGKGDSRHVGIERGPMYRSLVTPSMGPSSRPR
jgi:hypothetical protein